MYIYEIIHTVYYILGTYVLGTLLDVLLWFYGRIRFLIHMEKCKSNAQ